MNNSHFEEILGCFYNLWYYRRGLLFAYFSISSHVLEQISLTTELSNQIAKVPFFYDIFEPNYIWVAHFFENLDFVLKHLQARIGVFLHIDNFDRVFTMVFGPTALKNIACITWAYFIFFAINVVAYHFCILL